jgi:hypothetical protein
MFDLYAADSGWFNDGQNFLVEVTFGDGSKWTDVAAVGAPPATGSVGIAMPVTPPVSAAAGYRDLLLSGPFEWVDNGQSIGTITFAADGSAKPTWSPPNQAWSTDVNGDLLVHADGTRWVTRLRYDPASGSFSGARDATSMTQDGVQTLLRPHSTAARLARLHGSLSREDYARLYADLSVIIARYGSGAGWLDGQDLAGSPNDPGRGVLSWDAHYGHAISSSADLGPLLMARLSELQASIFIAQMIIDLETEVARAVSKYDGARVAVSALEEGIDRPGMDYASFDLDQADPALCQAACEQAAECRAFTYVAPGAQGAAARCWLKSGVPAPQPNSCCVSGVKGAGATIDTGTTITVTVGPSDGYLGCFKDPNNPFDLDGHLERSASNTPQRCIDICRSQGFAYAGVQYAESCLCGNRYGQFGAADNCDMACTGDSSQICGGANANSVYAVGSGGQAGGAIQVVSGSYGTVCGQPEGNVTDHLAAACNGKTVCDYKVDYTVIGDPANGCQKDYIARWRCGEGDVVQSSTAAPEAGYGSVVRLGCATN